MKNRHAISGVCREGIRKVSCNGIGFVCIENKFEESHGDDVFAIVDVLNAVEEVADRDLS